MSEDIEKNTNGTKQNTEQSVEQSVVQNAAGGNLSQAMSAPTGETQRRKETTLIAVIIILAILVISLVGVVVFCFVTMGYGDDYGDSEDWDGVEIVYVKDEDEEKKDEETENTIVEKYTSLLLTPERSLNGNYSDGFVVYIRDSTASGAISVMLQNAVEDRACAGQPEESKVWLNLNWDEIKRIYPHIEIGKSGYEDVVVDDIDAGKVTDVLVSGFGQAVGDETVFFLMADGTVEYLPLEKALKDGKIKSYGKLGGVENVIKFYKGSISSGCYGGGLDVFAQRTDGKFYSMYGVLRENEVVGS